MLVFTDQRTYSIKLISTQKQWTPMTAFSYPESAQAAWANYGATMGSAGQSATATNPMGGATIDMEYRVSGNAPWKPQHVYTMGGKTYIQFPNNVRYSSAPALVGLANDGGWFSSPSEQMVIYRVVGNQYVVDGVLDHAKLIAGVGGGQQSVDIRRTGN
jgi:type IV secretion system protein VirB9